MEELNHHVQLKRVLKLPDLILMQILVVFGLNFTSYAAKQGPTHVALWIAGIVGFYAPLSAIVAFLSREFPFEGGLYRWLKEGITPLAAFMGAWNYTVFYVLLFANDGASLANSIVYLVGPQLSWLSASKSAVMALDVLIWCLIVWVNQRGLVLIRWLSDIGAVLVLAQAATYIVFLLQKWASGQAIHSFSFASPGLSLLSLAVFSKISLNALSGIEGASIVAGECTAPEKSLTASVWIAAPIIAFLFIICTGAVLAYIRPEDIDLVAPVPQMLRMGFGSTAIAGKLATIAIMLSMILHRIQIVLTIGMVSRLPMVAGWDGLLPGWWSQLHPVHRTPVNALRVIAVSALLFALASLIGAGQQEAFQVTTSAATAALCLVYLALFALIAVGFKEKNTPPLWLRVAGVIGVISTTVSLVFQLVPLVAVTNRAIFGVKVASTLLVLNCVGFWLYCRRPRYARIEEGATE